MHRQGGAVACCTVERLMRDLGLKDEVRGRGVRATRSNPAAANPLDRVNRNFTAKRPNLGLSLAGESVAT
jgi:putative transposase